MIIDCISDLHGHYPKLEGGDLLIVAGDLTAGDRYEQYVTFFEWLKKHDYSKKVFICGNHDNLAMSQFDWGDEETDYLYDSCTEFEGLKIWGSPWTKTFPGMNPHCKAFTVDTEEELAEKWALIPDDTDILITHSPPLSCLDFTRFISGQLISGFGSKSLCDEYHRIKPRLHVFGHIHEGYGQDKNGTTKFINASHVNERYEPVNKPIRVTL